jgi:hypothetical protein
MVVVDLGEIAGSPIISRIFHSSIFALPARALVDQITAFQTLGKTIEHQAGGGLARFIGRRLSSSSFDEAPLESDSGRV